ncbi:MAG: transglycosylase SLT domain-containing protein [Bacteroidia bacterium]
MRFIAALFVLFYSCNAGAIAIDKSLGDKGGKGDSLKAKSSCGDLCSNVVGLVNPITNYNENYIFDSSLYRLKVDTLPQIKFWRQIMKLHEDSSLLCYAHNRTVIRRISNKEWNQKSDSLKKYYRDSIRMAARLDSTNRILLTTGKKFFYDFDRTYQNFHNGINCFVENGVDPWYAQAILLIESPNKLQKSNAGAYGPFQLMKDVARLYGLKVNRQVDERANFERSAYAASSLIKTICIPKVRKILDTLGIKEYNESELWFKLLVMHTYHAGSYNVQNALFTFMPTEGNMQLIYNLWHAQTGRFKSASQNYSQLILAAMLEMNERSPVLKNQGPLVKAGSKPAGKG